MSNNIQFIELEDKVYKRYQKTILGALSGWRVNPHNHKERMDFLIMTPDSALRYKKDSDGYDLYDGRDTISYEDEIIEIYSPEEDRLFKRYNEKHFKDGVLVEYQEERILPDVESNALTDKEVIEIAALRLPNQFSARVKGITSLVTLSRIQEALDKLGRPKSFYNILNSHREKL